MKRRALLSLGAALGCGAHPVWSQAPTPAGVPRVGLLFFGSHPSSAEPETEQGFAQGLREWGYLPGQNIVIERRYANGQPERLVALAAELVRMKVAVIIAAGPAPREAASRATRAIPIIAVSGSDPMQEGWAVSLAHPGGNQTGLTVTVPELTAKHLELLKSAFPQVQRVAVLFAPDELLNAYAIVRELGVDAQRLGLSMQALEIRRPADVDGAFSQARQHKAQACYAIATNLIVTNRSRIAALAIQDRLPSISEFPWMAQAGFLMAYGADLEDLHRRAIAQLHKILKGARAGDLPIERPTKLQLTVNLATARRLGIVTPQSLMLRADEVIQ